MNQHPRPLGDGSRATANGIRIVHLPSPTAVVSYDDGAAVVENIEMSLRDILRADVLGRIAMCRPSSEDEHWWRTELTWLSDVNYFNSITTYRIRVRNVLACDDISPMATIRTSSPPANLFVGGGDDDDDNMADFGHVIWRRLKSLGHLTAATASQGGNGLWSFDVERQQRQPQQQHALDRVHIDAAAYAIARDEQQTSAADDLRIPTFVGASTFAAGDGSAARRTDAVLFQSTLPSPVLAVTSGMHYFTDSTELRKEARVRAAPPVAGPPSISSTTAASSTPIVSRLLVESVSRLGGDDAAAAPMSNRPHLTDAGHLPLTARLRLLEREFGRTVVAHANATAGYIDLPLGQVGTGNLGCAVRAAAARLTKNNDNASCEVRRDPDGVPYVRLDTASWYKVHDSMRDTLANDGSAMSLDHNLVAITPAAATAAGDAANKSTLVCQVLAIELLYCDQATDDLEEMMHLAAHDERQRYVASVNAEAIAHHEAMRRREAENVEIYVQTV